MQSTIIAIALLLFTLTTYLSLTTALPYKSDGSPTNIGKPSPKHSTNTMTICDSSGVWDKIKYISNVDSQQCVPIAHPGNSRAGLRPSDDVWCTIYASADCSVDSAKDMKQQQFVGLEAPGVRQWDEKSSWWVKEGYEWYPGSFQCFPKRREQVGLSTGVGDGVETVEENEM